MRIAVSRTRVRPGGQTLIWASDGTTLQWQEVRVGSLGDIRTNVYGVDEHNGDRAIVGVTVPEDAEVGGYEITVNGEVTGTFVEVLPPAPEREIKYVDDIHQLEDIEPWTEVRLRPGTYRVTGRGLSPPEGTRVVGWPNAVIEWDSDRHRWVFEAAPFLELENLTIRPTTREQSGRLLSEATGGYVIHAHNAPTAWNNLIRNCYIHDMHLGEWDRKGLVIDGCTFSGGYGGPQQLTDHVTMINSKVTGIGTQCSLWEGDAVAIVNCMFDWTGRGIVIQPHRGEVKDCLFNRITFRSIQHISNGGEVFLVEGFKNPVHHCRISDVRVQECEGMGVQLWQSNVHDCTFQNIVIEGGGGIKLLGDNHNNLFSHVELRHGPRVQVGKGNTGNQFKEIAVVQPSPTRGNQSHFVFEWYDYKGKAAFDAENKEDNNTLTSCVVVQPSGYLPYKGFSVAGVKLIG